METDKYYKKYLKYRSKYLALKGQSGGSGPHYFYDGERIRHLNTNKTGKIERFREIDSNGTERYSVTYDDGTFDTYEAQTRLLRLEDRDLNQPILNQNYNPSNPSNPSEPYNPSDPSNPSNPSNPYNPYNPYNPPNPYIYQPPLQYNLYNPSSYYPTVYESKKSSKKKSKKSSKKKSKKNN